MQQEQNHYRIKCKSHPKNEVLYIQINDLRDNKSLFYCETCISKDQNFKPWNFVSVNQILNSKDNSIVFYWPPLLDNELSSQIMDLAEVEAEGENTLQTQVDQYFDSLTKEVLDSISKCKDKMMVKAQSLSQINQKIHQKYQEVSKINLFRQIFQETEFEPNDKDKQCRYFIHEFHNNIKENTEALSSLFKDLDNFNQRISFKKSSKIKDQMISLIEDIELFEQTKEIETSEELNASRGDEKNEESYNKIDQLVQLIAKRENFLTDEFINSIKVFLENSQDTINQISFEGMHIDGQKPVDLSQLDQKQMEVIRQLSEYYAQLNKDQFLANQIKQSKEIQSIKQILQSKWNFINRDFQLEFEGFLVDTYPILQNLNLDNIFISKEKFLKIAQVSEQFQSDLFQLAQKKQELSSKHCYENSQSFKILSQLTYLYSYFNQKDLLELIQKYPVFDLIHPIKSLLKIKDILPDIELKKYELDQEYSKNLKMERNAQDNQITISSDQNKQWGYYYSNIILEKDKKYIFRLKVTQVENQKEQSYLGFGLVRDKQKDKSYCYTDDLSCSLCFNNNSISINKNINGITNLVKGNFIGLPQSQEFELIISINQKILELSDFPNYEHKLTLINEFKDKLVNYENLRFFIGIDGQIEAKLTSAYNLSEGQQY